MVQHPTDEAEVLQALVFKVDPKFISCFPIAIEACLQRDVQRDLHPKSLITPPYHRSFIDRFLVDHTYFVPDFLCIIWHAIVLEEGRVLGHGMPESQTLLPEWEHSPSNHVKPVALH